MRHCTIRNIKHRWLESSLLRSILLSKCVTTTVQRAKKIRPIVEKFITMSKDASREDVPQQERLAKQRLIRARLRSNKTDEIMSTLMKDIVAVAKDRNGGYTRIVRFSSKRKGDGAEMARFMIIGFDGGNFVKK